MVFRYATSLLKKGTGSERKSETPGENTGCEVPVPLFQQAATGLRDGTLASLCARGPRQHGTWIIV
jgi:hypothetical protein